MACWGICSNASKAGAAVAPGLASDDVMAALMPDIHELAGLKVELQLLQRQLAQLQAAVQQKQAAVEQKQRQLDEKQGKLVRERGLAAGAAEVAALPPWSNRRKLAAAAAAATSDISSPSGVDVPAAARKAAPAAAVDVAMQDAPEDPEATALFALDMLAVAAEDAHTGAAAAATATPAGVAAAAPVDPAAVAAAEAAAAAAQMPDERNVAAMPGWLLRSLQDGELHSPSYKLVPLDNDGAGSTAARLRHVAAASARLPNQDGAGAAGASSSSSSGEWGLPLGAPRSFWLLGDLAKAESAKYKVSGSWGGCPVIHVDTPDEGVFGCCIALEHPLPPARGAAPGAAGMLAAAAAAVEAEGGGDGERACEPHQRRPRVWLRCWRPVAQGGVQQPRQGRQQQGDGGERERPGRLGWDWQVLVNGAPYPSGQGREGLQLEAGDELTVQGVRLKLVAAA
ncbi:hypothetical protein COO60DRAFT_726227 [Scenedesmus sp. NREL 46B-D3]|nr:hypothetical protein COO60DRAFT_726227 [Scenedesmus sp. NREL 46B-D3]